VFTNSVYTYGIRTIFDSVDYITNLFTVLKLVKWCTLQYSLFTITFSLNRE